MKIAVWRTGHEIADTVAEAVYEGLKINNCAVSLHSTSELEESLVDQAEVHIAYGILRGCSDVFKSAERRNKNYVEIDRGYWLPAHYSGYYRISINGTQQTFGLDKLKPDYERWDKLGLSIDTKLPTERRLTQLRLVCPPTDYVAAFFGTDERYWSTMNAGNTSEYLFRRKNCDRSLQQDFNATKEVITFNSSVGWEALRQGIPVVSDPEFSILGAYQKMLDIDLSKDSNERRKFFAIQCSLQRTLSEIREGQLWPLLQTLLTIH